MDCTFRKNAIEELRALQKAKGLIEKTSFFYADGSLQAKQVGRILKEMKEIKDIANNFIETMS